MDKIIIEVQVPIIYSEIIEQIRIKLVCLLETDKIFLICSEEIKEFKFIKHIL